VVDPALNTGKFNRLDLPKSGRVACLGSIVGLGRTPEGEAGDQQDKTKLSHGCVGIFF
jgi:hypothetical protein